MEQILILFDYLSPIIYSNFQIFKSLSFNLALANPSLRVQDLSPWKSLAENLCVPAPHLQPEHDSVREQPNSIFKK